MPFQSTLTVWGATLRKGEERAHFQISIHAPRVGSDTIGTDLIWRLTNFNPRSPCGERRSILPFTFIRTNISIHAPRVGSDARRHRMLD